jgi:hypothetical protein
MVFSILLRKLDWDCLKIYKWKQLHVRFTGEPSETYMLEYTSHEHFNPFLCPLTLAIGLILIFPRKNKALRKELFLRKERVQDN